MLSSRLFKHFGWRVKLMGLGGGTYYNWDPATEQLVLASPYQIYLMRSGFAGGIFFPVVHMIQIYLKTHEDDGILDEGLSEEERRSQSGSAMSPSILIEYGEVLLVICIFFLNIVSNQRMELHMYLINQLITYNKLLQEMIDSGKLVLEREQEVMAHVGEAILYVVFLATILLPFGIVASMLHPVEPTHILVREWLEIEFGLRLELLPCTVVMMQVTYACGTTIGMMMMSITLYTIFATVPMDAITPERVEGGGPGRAKRCRLETGHFGVLEDEEIVHFYRTQQVLNVCLNEFYKSVLISYHHIGCLATAVCLICFVIGYHDILSEGGVVAYVVIVSCIWAPFALIFIQSRMGGIVVDTSEGFQDRGRKLTWRGTFFNKFCRSCQTFYIQVAWPFYNIHKETFLLFCEQVLDMVMELLMR